MAPTTMAPTLTEGDGVFPVGLNTSSDVPIWPSDVNATTTAAAAVMTSSTAAVDDWADTITSASVTTSGHHILKDMLQKNLSDVVTALRLTPPSSTSNSVDVTAAAGSTITEAAWSPDVDIGLGDALGSSSLTYEADDEYSLHIEASKQLWELVRQDETVVLVVFLSIVTCVGLVAVVVSKIVLRRRHQYQLIPNQDPTHRFNYIYRPIHGNAALDDEYENTFVGVSIPILQDNTRI